MISSIKKKSSFFISILLAGTFAFALDVNQTELRSVGTDDTIKFTNYEGPQSVINSAESIRGIGSSLGQVISRSPETEQTVSPGGLYSVIHAIDISDNKGLDADIILINKGASVDHIDNVRRILTGYLMAGYNYSRKDAETLAVFITVYNAVYRNNLDAYTARYKAVVLKYLTKESCGLSTRWSDWAGNTQIVIPLYDVNGGLSTVETSVISDNTVISSMQEEADKGIDSRKDMVDIKEREAENAEKAAQEAAQTAALAQQDAQDKAKEAKNASDTAAQSQKDADKADKDAQDAQSKADDAQSKADEAKAKSDENPDDKALKDKADEAQKAADEAQKSADEAQKAADEAQKAADEAQKSADEAQKAADEAQKAADEANATASEEQALADKKLSEAQNERVNIAKDQQTLINESSDTVSKNTVAGLIIKDAQEGLYAIVKVDADSGKVAKESPVGVIRGRNIYAVSGVDLQMDDESIDTSVFYLAVCGQNKGNGTVKLCLIDNTKLEIQKESEETLAENTVLIKDGDDYYCIVVQGESYTLAKFDKNLKLLLKSDADLDPATPVVITEKGIVVTSSAGSVLLLSLSNLKQVTQ